jgi:hypothetical protein
MHRNVGMLTASGPDVFAWVPSWDKRGQKVGSGRSAGFGYSVFDYQIAKDSYTVYRVVIPVLARSHLLPSVFRFTDAVSNVLGSPRSIITGRPQDVLPTGKPFQGTASNPRSDLVMPSNNPATSGIRG